MEDTDLSWRKSSYSSNGGATCVEIGQTADGVILVRDTKDHGRGPVHRYIPDEWRALVAGVRAGKFDMDESGPLL